MLILLLDVKDFPTSNHNRRNVVCLMHDQNGRAHVSSLWANHGKVFNCTCKLPINAGTLNLFNSVVHFDSASGFNGDIECIEILTTNTAIPSGLTAARMTYLCEKYNIQLMVPPWK